MHYSITKPDESHIDSIQDMVNIDPKHLLPRTRAEILALLDTFFIALDEWWVPIGCVCLEIYSKRIAELRSLYVDPRFRGNGIGPSLIRSIQDLKTQKGIKELFTITNLEAIDTFDKCDFKPALPGEKIALFWRG